MPLTPSEQEVLEHINKLRDELITLCQDLVRIPSWNRETRGEAEVVHRVGKTLEKHHLEAEYFSSHPSIENLIAPLDGKETKHRLLFNGHSDVVPPGDDWTFEPFAGEIKGDHIFGRGTTDMKGGVASATMALCALRDLEVPLRGTVILNVVGDEERQGQLGTAWCIKYAWKKIKANAAIISEPSGVGRFVQMVFVGEKGPVWAKVTTKGTKAHGSIPLMGKNAITMMFNLLSTLQNQGPPTIPPPIERDALLQGLAEAMGIQLTDLEPFLKSGGPSNPLNAGVEALTTTSMNIGRISGGVAPNIVPDRCEAEVDFRILPGQKPQEMIDAIGALAKELGFENDVSTEIIESFEGTAIPNYKQNPIVTTLFSVSKELSGPTAFSMAPFATDARLLRKKGLTSAAVYGPGDAFLAHTADENILINDLVKATKVYAITAMRYLGLA